MLSYRHIAISNPSNLPYNQINKWDHTRNDTLNPLHSLSHHIISLNMGVVGCTLRTRTEESPLIASSVRAVISKMKKKKRVIKIL